MIVWWANVDNNMKWALAHMHLLNVFTFSSRSTSHCCFVQFQLFCHFISRTYFFFLFSFFIPNKFEHKNSHCHKHSEFTHVKLFSKKSRSYCVNVFDMICLVLALKLTKCSFCWYIFLLDLLQRWRRSYSNNKNGIFISQLHGIKVNWHLRWTHPFDVGCKSVGTTILRMRLHEAITLLPINCVFLSLINVRKKHHLWIAIKITENIQYTMCDFNPNK